VLAHYEQQNEEEAVLDERCNDCTWSFIDRTYEDRSEFWLTFEARAAKPMRRILIWFRPLRSS
jgi:hypothetical protein